MAPCVGRRSEGQDCLCLVHQWREDGRGWEAEEGQAWIGVVENALQGGE